MGAAGALGLRILLDLLGYAGTAVVIAAYAPQIWHLYREQCSAGISVRTYGLWIGGSLLFLGHATVIEDPVFTLVQVVNVLALSTIVILARRYRGQVCEVHAQVLEPREPDEARGGGPAPGSALPACVRCAADATPPGPSGPDHAPGSQGAPAPERA